MLAENLEPSHGAAAANDAVIEAIEKAISDESIKLPAMPDIALNIKTVFEDEQYDINHIARIIQTEAGLAAYVLKVANSPLHRGPIPIKTAKHAVCRLGQQSVQSIALTYTVRSLFESSSTKLNSVLENQWEESTTIAAISSVLAERCVDFDPDQALLAGLLQDIGGLPIINWLNDHHDQADDLEAEYAHLKSRYAARIGERLLRSWQFADELIEVVCAREDWRRDSGPRVDAADIVTIARHHYYMGKHKLDVCPGITEIAAYHKLPFQELSPDQSLKILAESKEDIAEIKGVLAGG